MKDKKAVKIYASLFLGFSCIFTVLLAFACWILTLIAFLQGGNDVTSPETMRNVFIAISCILGLTIISAIRPLHRGFSLIAISERGIRKSLFRGFRKREIKWEELQELRFILWVGSWIFASKSSLQGLNYNQLKKKKDTIQIPFSKKAYDGIRQHCNLPINGASNEVLLKFGIE